MMNVVIAHTIEQAIAAFDAAAELGAALTLQSAPDAIFYAGSLYLLHMFDYARRSYPKVKARFVVDCDGAGAEAIAAIGMGHKYLRLSGDTETQEKLADIASQCGAEIITEPFESLDLQQVEDAKAACREWLQTHPARA